MGFITDLNFMILVCQLISGNILFLFPIHFKKELKQEFPKQKKSHNNPYNAIRISDQQLCKHESTTIRVALQMFKLKCYIWKEDKWKCGSQKGVHFGRNYLMLVRNMPLARLKKIKINFKQPMITVNMKAWYYIHLGYEYGYFVCSSRYWCTVKRCSCMLKLFYKYAGYASWISKYFLLISVAVIKEEIIITH